MLKSSTCTHFHSLHCPNNHDDPFLIGPLESRELYSPKQNNVFPFLLGEAKIWLGEYIYHGW